MVTCLYRGVAAPTLGSRLEALGISTDFSASVLAAQLLEDGLSFGLGSTLAFRRKELDQIGGFRTIVGYLADDYELGHRIAGLGLKVVLSNVVVRRNSQLISPGSWCTDAMDAECAIRGSAATSV